MALGTTSLFRVKMLWWILQEREDKQKIGCDFGLLLFHICMGLERLELPVRLGIQNWETGNQHLISVVLLLRQMLERHLLNSLVEYHLEFIMLPLFLSPFPPFSPVYLSLSLSLLPRLMAVEDELRGGPMIEPKTRIFADQVCETAFSLSPSPYNGPCRPRPPYHHLSPLRCYCYSFVCCVCVWSLLIILPCPWPVPVFLSANLPGCFGDQRMSLFAFLSSGYADVCFSLVFWAALSLSWWWWWWFQLYSCFSRACWSWNSFSHMT